MSPSTPQDFDTRVDRNVIERSQHDALMERLVDVYDASTVQRIARTHGLAVIHISLSATLRDAGSLYLRYGSSSSQTVRDLGPKLRAIARTAEISKSLSSELENLDFWDCWQIFQNLHSTGHPLTEQLDPYTAANPLLAGNLIIEEIRLLLKSIARFEENFFEVLANNTDKKIDLGLYLFVEVVGTVWQSLTGKKAVRRKRVNTSEDRQAGEVSDEAFVFLTDSIAPLASVSDEDMKAAIQSALG